MTYSIICNNAISSLRDLKDDTIDCVIIDPPYGIDKMNVNWDEDYIESEIKNSNGSVKGLPRGMAFNPKSSKIIGDFIYLISLEIIRVIKPGGFYITFSQARSSHRIGCAIEDAGFELRDQLIWNYGKGQGKAQGVQNFIKKSKSIDNQIKDQLIIKLNGFKTPQLTPTYETMWLGQKPKEGSFVNNYIKYGVGLVDFRTMIQSNTFFHKKPLKQERIDGDKHPTQKPVDLIIDLINTFCPENGMVLDCFCGSGTTGIACVKTDRDFMGMDKSSKCIETTKRRMKDITTSFF